MLHPADGQCSLVLCSVGIGITYHFGTSFFAFCACVLCFLTQDFRLCCASHLNRQCRSTCLLWSVFCVVFCLLYFPSNSDLVVISCLFDFDPLRVFRPMVTFDYLCFSYLWSEATTPSKKNSCYIRCGVILVRRSSKHIKSSRVFQGLRANNGLIRI